MELSVSHQSQKQSPQPTRKSSPVSSHKDLWLAVREGSLADIDSALASLKKNGGNINARNSFGLTYLHIATWRNRIPVVRRLLAAGADPDARDGESGWSSLHRAFHFGHLAVASILLQSGASITLEDSKSRTPVDLLSGPVAQIVENEDNSLATEVFSWGSGVNYQLGTGNAHLQKLPCKVDSLHGCFIKLISAAKFHSVAVSSRGEVYTWGFGRGGRLGHPDFDIHSGQAAIITPRQVTYGLGSRRVRAIAAAKHHTVLATESGEVFTWGSNREGQLGYTSVDTQPTPRRVSSLKSKIVAVAAANKHTAVVSESGEVFTWGCNREGQLGYGTSNSASNYTPRLVDYLKGKEFTAVSAAKYHTVVLGADGEAYTWGHRLVTPKRVIVARNLKKGGNTPLKFHRMDRLHVSAIAAGMVYSMALTDDGALFYWVSSDPDLRCQQVYSLSGKNLVSLSAGKYWTAAVTATGDVYRFDGKKGTDTPPVATRLHGIKRATSVAVGETHLLIVGSLYHPTYSPNLAMSSQNVKSDEMKEFEFDEDFLFADVESKSMLSCSQNDDLEDRCVPSLKSLCEKVAAECLVEPRNSVQLLEIADSLGAGDLKKYCEEIVVRNLDFIVTMSSHSFANVSLDVLANLEKLLDLKSSEAWSYRRLPTPTATFTVIIDSEEEDSESEFLRTRANHAKKFTSIIGDPRVDSFLQPKDNPNEGISKQVRALRKKLQQIEILEAKQSSGHLLDDQQIAKLQTRVDIERSLTELGVPVETIGANMSSSMSTDLKGSKKGESSGKQRRKSKQRGSNHVEPASDLGDFNAEANPVKNKLSDCENSEAPKDEEENKMSKVVTENLTCEEPAILVQRKDNLDAAKNKTSSLSTATKKKNRKGGLSMFLSGALDDTPKVAILAPQKPKTEGPAWGGAKVPKGSSSLREILNEQSKTQLNMPAKTNNHVEDVVSCGISEGKIPLSSFLPSKPIPVSTTRTLKPSDSEKGTPPWAASGTPPHPSRPSLRDIQMQQVKKKESLSHSPKTKTAGFSIATGQGSPIDSPALNRWFKPEIDSPSSLRSIQIEEKAMKDLRRLYNSVKLIKNQS